ncbi:MAG TPA: peptidoglycan-associated lipoprotein Pal [Burkholderiaceae bacterium]|nr:peptidoglycan-associated lipoprotein Pal [Burkholderiaceae bacterium]
MNRLPLFLCSALTVAACSTTPLPPAPAPVAAAPAPAPVAIVTTPQAKPAPVANTESAMQAFDRMRSSLDGNSIYFDYDKYAIRDQSDPLISQHAKLLEGNSHDVLTLQGNCDERGGSEYNLALGQRRADAVKEKLVLLGVPAGRIQTVSFGKEKPREACHEERCWSENRRADFVDAWK